VALIFVGHMGRVHHPNSIYLKYGSSGIREHHTVLTIPSVECACYVFNTYSLFLQSYYGDNQYGDSKGHLWFY
jgi:hypothetical protein